MNDINFSWERFVKIPAIGIIRNITAEDVQQILPLYLATGLTTVEITMNSPDVEKMIADSLTKFGGQLNIGAGTVCTEADLDKALDAGARFIVTPVVQEKIITRCRDKGIPVFAGAYTPTEIFTAWSLGADVVKVFPMGSNGLEYIRSLKGPLDHIKLLPTGGVNLDNCADFLKAGVFGLGLGSQLFDKNFIRDKNWEALSVHFERFAQTIQGALQKS